MTSQRGAYALHAGLTRLHALMRMYTPTRPGTHTHARTRTHAHRAISNYYFPTATMIRHRALVLRYMYVAHLVLDVTDFCRPVEMMLLAK